MVEEESDKHGGMVYREVCFECEDDSGTPNPVASLNQDLHLYGSPYRWLVGTGVGVPEFTQ